MELVIPGVVIEGGAGTTLIRRVDSKKKSDWAAKFAAALASEKVDRLILEDWKANARACFIRFRAFSGEVDVSSAVEAAF